MIAGRGEQLWSDIREWITLFLGKACPSSRLFPRWAGVWNLLYQMGNAVVVILHVIDKSKKKKKGEHEKFQLDGRLFVLFIGKCLVRDGRRG